MPSGNAIRPSATIGLFQWPGPQAKDRDRAAGFGFVDVQGPACRHYTLARPRPLDWCRQIDFSAIASSSRPVNSQAAALHRCRRRRSTLRSHAARNTAGAVSRPRHLTAWTNRSEARHPGAVRPRAAATDEQSEAAVFAALQHVSRRREGPATSARRRDRFGPARGCCSACSCHATARPRLSTSVASPQSRSARPTVHCRWRREHVPGPRQPMTAPALTPRRPTGSRRRLADPAARNGRCRANSTPGTMRPVAASTSATCPWDSGVVLSPTVTRRSCGDHAAVEIISATRRSFRAAASLVMALRHSARARPRPPAFECSLSGEAE